MLARTPPLGWNSWNTFGPQVDASVILETADAMVDRGLLAAGYEFIVIDDFWEHPERVDGRLTWNEQTFPDGIRPVADAVHAKGFKFGIYSCAGTLTCGGLPGSFGYEEEDAQTFAEWDVDFLKYDFCFFPPQADPVLAYRRMGQALRMTGRPIVYSLCEWGTNKPWEWADTVGAHMWRTTLDIEDCWDSILAIGFEKQARLHRHAGPGRWNDPDMLVVGMRNRGHVAKGGCTDSEYRCHFSLWCLLAAPLMIGCDVRTMDDVTAEMLLNPRLLAVNQDPLGIQAYQVGKGHSGNVNDLYQVWAKPLHDGSIAVGLFHLGERAKRGVPVSWESLGLQSRRPCRVQDLWTGEDLGIHERHVTAPLNTHDCSVLKISPLR
jgi:alpha-galactosidase